MKELIILVVLSIVLFIIFRKSEKLEPLCNQITIDKVFLLSIPTSKERRENFLNSYKAPIPLEIIWGVDTKNPENVEKFRHLVNPDKFNTMYLYDNGEPRPNHHYLNSGALGCYIGHMDFYKKSFNQHLKYTLIFEDNVILEPNFYDELQESLRTLGESFDVCFFHCWTHIGDQVTNNCGNKIEKLKWITSTKCYLINVESMKKYYNMFYPIDNHVDLVYEELIAKGANIYLIPLKSIKIQKTHSLINHSSVLSDNPFKVLDHSEKKKIKKC